ncbi:MAG: AhpC/TSA family protein [Bacteroidales bacterium]|nr:AhpC/TSA family protein [Bacteroidales bacterium]
MNRIFTFLLTVVVALTATAQKPCKITGKVSAELNSQKLYVYVSNPDLSIGGDGMDSVVVKNGKFTYTTKFGEVRRALFVPVMNDGKSVSMNQAQIMLVPGEKATLDINKNDFTVGGSPFYEQWNGAEQTVNNTKKQLMEFWTKANKEVEGKSQEEIAAFRETFKVEYAKQIALRNEAISNYGKQHIAEEGCAAYYVLQVGPASQYYDLTTEAVKNGRLGALLKERAEEERAQTKAQAEAEAKAKAAEEVSKEGKMFVDFEAEYNGKVQKLSDYVGKGKYVLVDFWASWCGPCKAEIPNLIEVYNKYKGDKFMVLGVATWDKPKDTEKAIEQMKIPYPQIMNAQKAGSDAYGILGIPQIILFGPDGTILKRDLRGEVIEATVKSYLEK